MQKVVKKKNWIRKEYFPSSQAQKALRLWKQKYVLMQLSRLKTHSIVMKDKKQVGLIARLDGKKVNPAKWIYYPKIEHFMNFDLAGRSVRAGGPAEHFLGSVGSVVVTKLVNAWRIGEIQSHFKTTKDGPVNRALATKYGDWRHRLLTEILREAKLNKKKVIMRIVSQRAAEGQKKSSNEIQEDILDRVAENEGFTVEKKGNFMTISPKNSQN